MNWLMIIEVVSLSLFYLFSASWIVDIVNPKSSKTRALIAIFWLPLFIYWVIKGIFIKDFYPWHEKWAK